MGCPFVGIRAGGWEASGDLRHRPVVILLESPRHEPEVDLRGIQAAMAQKLLNIPHIRAVLKQVDGDRVPEQVRVPAVRSALRVQVCELAFPPPRPSTQHRAGHPDGRDTMMTARVSPLGIHASLYLSWRSGTGGPGVR